MQHYDPHHDDPLRPHAHEPNPTPPSDDPNFIFSRPDGTEIITTVRILKNLPQITISNCYIVSTGHGSSGPFAFTGARLLDLIQSQLSPATAWSQVEVVSLDDFGNRIMAEELLNPDPAGPILLSYMINGQAMTREQGLVRLIVPSEKDDALRQVKWVGRITVRV